MSNMRCDVVAIGTELLLGQIVDTNSSYIGEQLAAVGIDSLLQVKVGDNLPRMTVTLQRVLADADAVIVCGGLGPTHDDVTREAIAAVMGTTLELDHDVAAVIKHLFESRGRNMPENNLRQAMVPVGATVIPQTRGTAPGLICPVGDKVIYAVPGVPHEMYDMLSRAVLPDLLERSGEDHVIVSRVIRTWGDSESGMNERLVSVIEELDNVGNPTLAFLASGWEGIKVRLTAKSRDEATARALLATWEQRVRDQVEEFVFGVDDETMESVVVSLLKQRGLTLSLAESVTGGLASGRITNVPGSSQVFKGAVISYASEVKFDILGVTPGPVVSESAAREMARGVRQHLGTDIGLSLTGVAGPEEQDGQPVGTLWVGLSCADGTDRAMTITLPATRDQMRQFSVISALDFLRKYLQERP
jgi:nicotinamide-nucleotide amidase